MTETTSAFRSWRMRFRANAQPYLIPFFIASSAFILYARILDVYFNSDDFILLRTMAGHSVPKSIVDHLTSPWLSLHFFLMYRPVSTLAFYLLYAVFGLDPLGYHLVGVSCHVINVVLVITIANSLTNHSDAHIGYAAGLLFALHPLHPNAVAWVSAFPTILSTLFLLVSLRGFLTFRETRLPRYYLLSLVSFVLALGTYEPVLVYPALLIGCDWVKNGGRISPHRIRALAALYAPYAVLVFAYLLVRKTLLGSFYFEAALGYHGGLILDRVSSYPRALAKLIYPLFSLDPWERSLRLGFLACFAAATVSSFRMLISRRENIGMAAFVLFWTFLATFVNEPVLAPAVGRYGYFASIGVCIGVSFLILRSLSLARPGKTRVLSMSLLVLVVFCYVRLLNQSLTAYQKAGGLAHVIQQQLVALDSALGGRNTYLMGNVPQYVIKDGYNVAQVLITGLADSVRPPFMTKEIPVYLFIDFSTPREVPAFATPRDIVLLSWNESLEQVQVAASPYPDQHARAPLPNIEVFYPPDKERVKGFGHNMGFAFAGGSHDKFRFLFVNLYRRPLSFEVGRDEIPHLNQHPAIVEDSGIPEDVRHAQTGGDTVFFTLFRVATDILSTVQDTYGGETFWWVEALDKEDNVVARSAMRSMRFERSHMTGRARGRMPEVG